MYFFQINEWVEEHYKKNIRGIWRKRERELDGGEE